jgi:hypothetical protein
MQVGDPDWKWRTASMTTRAVAVLCFVSAFGLWASLLLAGYVEYEALASPRQPAGVFVHPYEVKGVVRFVMEDLIQLDRVWQWMMLLSGAAVAGSWATFHWLSLRERRRRTIP